METFLLTSLEDHRPRRAFKKWCRALRRGPGITWVELRIRDVSDGNITLAHEFHREVCRAPVAVKTVLEGHNWLYGFLIWLAGPGRAVVGHATVFFGNDIVPYSDAFRLAQKMIEGPMYFTKYQEDRGYQLKTSLHLLLGSGIMDPFRGTHILGPKQLRELYQFDHLEPL